jgi:hypothetical protein
MADYPDERYRRDPQFAQLVDMLYMFFKRAEFTPTELREACVLAQIKYEQHHPRPILFSTQLLKDMGMVTNSERYKFEREILGEFPRKDRHAEDRSTDTGPIGPSEPGKVR